MVHLKAEGFTYKQIQKRLEDEGIRVSVKSLYQLVTKHRATMSVLDRTRGRAPKILQGEHYKFIDQALTDNDELTTQQLRTLLTEKFPTLTLSLSTVKRARRDLGEHYKFIDQALTDNDELTTRQLRTLLTEKFPTLTLSLSTVKRARRDLGWVVTSPNIVG